MRAWASAPCNVGAPLILLILLIMPSTQPAADAQPQPSSTHSYTPRLPQDVAQWHYNLCGPLGEVFQPPNFVAAVPLAATAHRYWSNQELSRAIFNPGLEQFKPLLDRLQSGEPIHVAAWGSSNVQNHAGCFQRSFDHIKGLIKTPLRTIRHAQYLCNAIGPNGWLHNFMQMVNATWPHANHTLFNAGRGGLSLEAFLAFCSEDELPNRVDLWVLENVDSRSSVPGVERVISNLLSRAAARRQPRPTIVLFDTAYVVDYDEHAAAFLCMRNATLCDSRCAPMANGSSHFAITGEAYASRHGGGMHLARAVAQYYGVTMLAEREYYASLMRDGFHTKRDWSECQLLAKTKSDEIHPNDVGRVLWADMFLNVLRLAEANAAQHPGVPPPGLPGLPLYPDGHHMQLLRCYMAEMDDWGYDTEETASHSTLLHAVVANDGWRFIERYNSSHGTTLFKPGMYAERAGAQLDVQVDATWGGGLALPNKTDITITYLVSWDRMGEAAVSCVRGCDCQAATIDAYNSARMSLQRVATLRLNATSSSCVLRLRALVSSRGADHYRFKLVNVVVAAEPAGALGLAFAPWTGFSAPANGV